MKCQTMYLCSACFHRHAAVHVLSMDSSSSALFTYATIYVICCPFGPHLSEDPDMHICTENLIFSKHAKVTWDQCHIMSVHLSDTHAYKYTRVCVCALTYHQIANRPRSLALLCSLLAKPINFSWSSLIQESKEH